jgi:hypothetical protein
VRSLLVTVIPDRYQPDFDLLPEMKIGSVVSTFMHDHNKLISEVT